MYIKCPEEWEIEVSENVVHSEFWVGSFII